MRRNQQIRRVLGVLGVLGVVAAPASAQRQPIPMHSVAYDVHTGFHDGTGEGTGDDAVLAFETNVVVREALWMNLRFDAANLGRGSFISLLATEDGGYQVMDGKSLPEWNMASAYFNGNEVILQLWVAPEDSGVFVHLFDVLAGDPPETPTESLCGPDNRVASTDNRVCRITNSGCTGWRVTNGALLTAGHCVDFDPDATSVSCGPLLPDGILDLNGVVEFNVPASNANGTIILAAPNDQYPINTANVTWRFDGCGQGLGKDWAVFAVNANTNTGLMPHQAYGFPIRMTRSSPSVGATIRITGFGVDNTPTGTTGGFNAQNQTNQTSTGNYVGETFVNGTDIYQEYQTDTTGGNSGSPILWNTLNIAIGIHTNGGCDATNGNLGTSFEVNALETAIAQFPGNTVRYSDIGYPIAQTEDGTIFNPFDTFTESATAVPAGGIVSMVAGTYTAAAGNAITVTKAMTIQAPVGTVVIGN